MTQEQALTAWLKLKEAADKAKEAELKCRNWILATYGPKEKGSEKFSVLVGDQELTFALTKKTTLAVESNDLTLDEIPTNVRDCFRQKEVWSIDMRKFNALPEGWKKDALYFCVEKPAQGTIELK